MTTLPNHNADVEYATRRIANHNHRERKIPVCLVSVIL